MGPIYQLRGEPNDSPSFMRNIYFLGSALDYVQLIIGLLLAAAVAIPGPVTTIFIGKVFTSLQTFFVNSQDPSDFMSDVLTYCVGIWSLGLISLVLHTLLYTVWTSLGFRQGKYARKQLYKVYSSSDLAWFDKHADIQGEILNSFKDIQDLELATGLCMSELVSMITAILVQIVIAFCYSWSVTLVCLAGVPVLAIIISFIGPCVTREVESSKNILQTISGRINWVLSALNTVKTCQREGYETLKVRQLLYKQQSVSLRYWNWFNLQQGIARFVVLTIFVQGFYFGSYMVRHHGLDAGSVVIVFWSILSAAGLLQVLMSHTIELQKGFISAQRLSDLFNKDIDNDVDLTVGQYPLKVDGEIRIENLVFSYPTRSDIVLSGASMYFPSGQMSYVIGNSGCGKSTLTALLSRQYPIHTGLITIDDKNIELLSLNWIHDNIYVVQQQPHLFDISLYENIRIACRNPESVTELDVESALMAVDALEFVDKLPDGLRTRGSYPLSGGQRQRIALARAWLCDRPIVILDEPTAALEEETQKRILSRLAKHRSGRTTILITHNYGLIPEDSPVLVMSDGTAQAFSSVSEAFSAGHDSFPEKSEAIVEVFQTEVEEVDLFEVKDYMETKVKSTDLEMYRSIPSKMVLFVGILAAAAHAIINPLFAMVFSHLIMGIFDVSASNITMWAMLVLLCAFGDGLTTYLKTILNIAAERWLRTVRDQIFTKLVFSRVHKDKATYYTKLIASDSEKCALIITLYWPGIVSIFILIVTGFFWAIATSWKLTLVSLSLLPVFLLTTQLYKRENQHLFNRREKLRSQVARLLTDIVAGHRTLKYTGLEAYFGGYYNAREAKLGSETRILVLRASIMHSLVMSFPFALEGLMIWFGMRMISRFESNPHDVMLVFSMVIFTITTIAQLMSTIASVGPGFEASQRLMAVLCAPDTENNSPAPKEVSNLNLRELSLEKVSIRYDSGIQYLGGITAQINPGETVAIAGPSGCGKSAIARMLMRLESPSQGHIYVGGEDLQDIPVDIIRREFSLVGQMPLDFFEGTIRENLWYALDLDDLGAEQNMKEICYLCGVDDFVSELEFGYDTEITPDLLSGGQLQRLGIARALMRQPQVLILDECTSALDVTHAEIIKSLIRDIKNTRRMTILVITHDSQLATVADRTILIKSPSSCRLNYS